MNFKPYWNNRDVIAFDVSTWSTGWAMWFRNNLTSGYFQPPPSMELLWERTRYLNREVRDLLYYHHGSDFHVFLEQTIPKGFQMVAMLSEARSAVVTAIPSIVTLANVSPSTWKSHFKCVRGKSAEEKAAAHKAMCELWNRDFPITTRGKERTYDETDAVAVLTYGLQALDYEEE